MLICSSTGKSICKKFIIKQSTLVSIVYNINNDCLNSNVNINPEGDSVTVIFYYNSISQPDEFVYGNYKNATIPKPRQGQSIATFYNNSEIHCIADSSGITNGIIHGHVYNKNNKLITNVSLSISPFVNLTYCYCDGIRYAIPDTFNVNSDGSYSATLFSLNYHFGKINICGNNPCGLIDVTGTSTIDSLNFTIEPDTSVLMDIHISGSYYDNIQTLTNNQDLVFKISPNPVNGNYFNYEINTPVISTGCYIDLLQINGQQLKRYNINANNGELQLPENISNGTYVLQLIINSNVYATNKIVVFIK
jgi:hypothetical protein